MRRTSPDPAIASGMLPDALAHRFCSQACGHHANQSATARSRRRSSAAEDADIRPRISSCQIASSRSAPIRLRQSSLHGKRDMPRRSHREPRIRSTPIRIPRCIQRARWRPALQRRPARPVRNDRMQKPAEPLPRVSRTAFRRRSPAIRPAAVGSTRRHRSSPAGRTRKLWGVAGLDRCEGAGPTYGISPTWRGLDGFHFLERRRKHLLGLADVRHRLVLNVCRRADYDHGHHAHCVNGRYFTP